MRTCPDTAIRGPKSNRRFLFCVALAIHAVALFALIVAPLTRVDGDMPKFEAMTTFLVRPPQAPPPPPPPPPAPPRAREAPKPAQPQILEASFLAPVAVPSAIPTESFGGEDHGVEGGVDGGIPGGVMGGIVGSLADAPKEPPSTEEPVRLDSRREETKPVARVEPVYPALAAQGRVQGIVILDVLVDVLGTPSNVKVLRSVPLLEAAAMDAVRQWRWKRYRIQDKPVPFRVTVTVNFRLA